MNIYIFTAMILLSGLVIVFLSKRYYEKDTDRHNSNADSTGGPFIDDDFESSSGSDADGGDGGGG